MVIPLFCRLDASFSRSPMTHGLCRDIAAETSQEMLRKMNLVGLTTCFNCFFACDIVSCNFFRKGFSSGLGDNTVVFTGLATTLPAFLCCSKNSSSASEVRILLHAMAATNIHLSSLTTRSGGSSNCTLCEGNLSCNQPYPRTSTKTSKNCLSYSSFHSDAFGGIILVAFLVRLSLSGCGGMVLIMLSKRVRSGLSCCSQQVPSLFLALLSQ